MFRRNQTFEKRSKNQNTEGLKLLRENLIMNNIENLVSIKKRGRLKIRIKLYLKQLFLYEKCFIIKFNLKEVRCEGV